MTEESVRGIVAIVIVVGFVGTFSTIASLPLVTGMPAAEFTEHLKTVGSYGSGLTGFVLGYYFGHRNTSTTERDR